jgi:hypothetical protein
MAWLIAVAILIVCVLIVTGFRKSAIGLALGVLIAGTSLYVYNERQEQKETSRIAVSEIAMENVDLRPTFRSGYDLVGTITNNSPKYRLDGIDVTVTLRDCKSKDKSTCISMGQASAHVAVTVPSGESRDMVASLHFGDERPKAKGTLAWDYEVTAVTAKRQ